MNRIVVHHLIARCTALYRSSFDVTRCHLLFTKSQWRKQRNTEKRRLGAVPTGAQPANKQRAAESYKSCKVYRDPLIL